MHNLTSPALKQPRQEKHHQHNDAQTITLSVFQAHLKAHRYPCNDQVLRVTELCFAHVKRLFQFCSLLHGLPKQELEFFGMLTP